MNNTEPLNRALKMAQQHLRPPVAADRRLEAVQAAQQAHAEADAALLRLSSELVRLALHDKANKVQEIMRELDALKRDIR